MDDVDIPFGVECSRSLTLFVFSGCRFLNLFPYASGGSFSGDGWARHGSFSIAECG